MEQLKSNSPFNIMGYIGAEQWQNLLKVTGPASAAAESIDEVEVIDWSNTMARNRIQ